MNPGICWAFATFFLFFSLISTALSVNQSSNSSAINLSNESFSVSFDDIYGWLKDNSEVLQSLAVLAGLFLYIKRYWLMHILKNLVNESESNIKLPYPRNPNFIGREEILNSLHEYMYEAPNTLKIIALVGNGGKGKTQIALEYAHRYIKDFKYIWFLNSYFPLLHESLPSSLFDDYISIAKDIGLREFEPGTTDSQIETVKNWLENKSHSPFLLIFDNADKLEDIEKYIPTHGCGQVIITSRKKGIWGNAIEINVDVFTIEEAIKFLLKITRRKNRENSSEDLAYELGCLPLALEQAGAYILKTGISFESYIYLFKNNKKKLLESCKPKYYPYTVATTWEISFQGCRNELSKLELKKDPGRTEPDLAFDLLSLFAFLCHEKIPRELLGFFVESIPDPLHSCIKDDLKFNKIIETLNLYSLIDASDDFYSMHNLLQFIVRDRLSKVEKKSWSMVAFDIIKQAFENEKYRDRILKFFSLYYRHLESALTFAKDYNKIPTDISSTLLKIGLLLKEQKKFDEARKCFKFGLSIIETTKDIEYNPIISDPSEYNDYKSYWPDPIKMDLTKNLGYVLVELDDLEGAMTAFLDIKDQDSLFYGPDDDRVAEDKRVIRSILEKQGKLDDPLE